MKESKLTQQRLRNLTIGEANMCRSEKILAQWTACQLKFSAYAKYRGASKTNKQELKSKFNKQTRKVKAIVKSAHKFYEKSKVDKCKSNPKLSFKADDMIDMEPELPLRAKVDCILNPDFGFSPGSIKKKLDELDKNESIVTDVIHPYSIGNEKHRK
ncbi:hypothetical protein BpHYR1_014137 [Brachionus plicatilis]|uniref:Uncharacterized protein n=1 Tax=Brachionus plicatilis TaxID=10195 RepID=A0A3M7PYZ4_BRAPC|nr:hypothetical protein BpHYR1_014137 [Brachionus plicatilis]